VTWLSQLIEEDSSDAAPWSLAQPPCGLNGRASSMRRREPSSLVVSADACEDHAIDRLAIMMQIPGAEDALTPEPGALDHPI
jgi:hypothetical protein